MLTSIITHPGGAHKDDFLACAVLLAYAPVVIQRREPTEKDLADNSIAVVDIGQQHVPKLSNFDHHQFAHDEKPICALSLVLQHLELYEDSKKFCSWLGVLEWFDCRGPIDTAQWLEIDREKLGQLNSPLDITLLRLFAKQSEHKPGEAVWEIMHMIGKDLVDFLTNLTTKLDLVADNAKIWELKEFKAIFMPRTNPLPEDASSGLSFHIEKLGLEDEVLALVYPDSRGKGYGMRLHGDDPRLDFTRIKDEKDVHFSHSRGFIAKTYSSDTTRLKELLELSYKAS